MATPKPKRFKAARPFSSRGRWYQTGDPVTDRRTIARLVQYGNKYLSWTIDKTASADNQTPSEEDK